MESCQSLPTFGFDNDSRTSPQPHRDLTQRGEKPEILGVSGKITEQPGRGRGGGEPVFGAWWVGEAGSIASSTQKAIKNVFPRKHSQETKKGPPGL